MWKKIKKLKILILAKYYFTGIILAVLVFQFISMSLTNQTLDLNAFIASETLRLLISTLAGAFAGGIIFLWMFKFEGKNDQILWSEIQKKNISRFRIENITTYSVGALVYVTLMSVFDAETYDSIIPDVISGENIINCISAVFAASVFAFVLSEGRYKRLKSLFEK